jgi:hypothetical protein
MFAFFPNIENSLLQISFSANATPTAKCDCDTCQYTVRSLHSCCILNYCNSGRGFKVYRRDNLDHVLKKVFARTITVQLVHRYVLTKKKNENNNEHFQMAGTDPIP